MEDGLVWATIVQKPHQFGYQSMRVLKELRDGRPVPPAVDTGVTTVTRENLAPFWSAARSRAGRRSARRVRARARGAGTVARHHGVLSRSRHRSARPAGRDPCHGPAAGRAAAARDAGRLHRARTHAHGFRRRIPIAVRRAPARRHQLVRAGIRGRADPGDDARGPRARRSRAIDEVRGQFSRVRQHEIAIAAALREALNALFEKLDPDALEEQLGRRTPGSAAPDVRAQLWSRYRDCSRDRAGRRHRIAGRVPGRIRARLRVGHAAGPPVPGDPDDRDA